MARIRSWFDLGTDHSSLLWCIVTTYFHVIVASYGHLISRIVTSCGHVISRAVANYGDAISRIVASYSHVISMIVASYGHVISRIVTSYGHVNEPLNEGAAESRIGGALYWRWLVLAVTRTGLLRSR